MAPIDITENFCTRFRQYLLDRFNGDTPANYFSRFKNVLKAATKEGYYRINPVEDVKAKSGKKRKLKEHLEAHEYIQLLKTPCYHQEIREAFILSCYTAPRWCDVRQLDWVDIKGDQLKTRIIQEKTGEPLIITLHPISKVILEKEKQFDHRSQIAAKCSNYLPMMARTKSWANGAGMLEFTNISPGIAPD